MLAGHRLPARAWQRLPAGPDETLRDRLQTRTTNAFGKHPEELAAALAGTLTLGQRYVRWIPALDAELAGGTV